MFGNLPPSSRVCHPFVFCAGPRKKQTGFLSDATSQACLADGHQPRSLHTFFPGERSGRRSGLSGTRET